MTIHPLFVLLATLAILASPLAVAQADSLNLEEAANFGEGQGLSEQASAPAVLQRVINLLLGIVGLLALLALIYGGVVIIANFGNDARVATGKKIIMWAIVGLIVVLLSYMILAFVVSSLGGEV